ncbi:asparagine synthase (glutamine-hydrolyzing) [Micromonospora sp. NBRC 101691]|uniref:asparagine synthase (glutamine-hydrolyzing) n=1 Tax=Micromonospora sp. NBRC 101691 TaxID=3032198 RepID=UPI0024A348D7|nr:asparagine synthase (glutamine-hydrolyzing) [Micromonospora sp. NBRC 101691]GLY26201.1 asparagine synthetase [glutamine-hydrolyzing] 2 [Micromonospora sp. NBRC 101691]
MCGLAGIALLGGAVLKADAEPLLQAMTTAVAHRGPDEQVVEREGPVGLGFTRLALVAPDAGDQPIHTPDEAVVLIANGEVYNHGALARTLASGAVMRTASDCEVLAHLYQERGLRFLEEVRGMFALVIYDAARNRLVLARDRFGIKPLYFHRNTERIVFASEIKALFLDPATPRGVNWEEALGSPVLQSAPVLTDTQPVTWFTGIDSVPPGTIIEIDLHDGRTRTRRYWEFPGKAPELPDSDDEFVERYRCLLAESVAYCATADAELGLLLSGGIDSAAVAALAVRSTPLHTFTILSPSTVETGDASFSHLVARWLGVPNHQVYVPRDHCPSHEEWLRFLWLMEHPMAGPEAYLKHEMYRYARAVRPSIKGMLLGAASDEFNGGNSVDISGNGDWFDFARNVAQMARRGEAITAAGAAVWNELLTAPVVRGACGAQGGGDDYQRFLVAEYRKVHQYNVWHEDRSAAGSGIEARVPFLDHRLVELVTAVPASRRERLLFDKRILRAAVRDLLPKEVVEREKVPFVYGSGVRHTHRMLIRMLTQEGGRLVEEALSGPGATEYLDGDALRQVVRKIELGVDVETADLVLRLLNLGLLDNLVATSRPALVETPVRAVLSAWQGAAFVGDDGQQMAQAVLGHTPLSPDAVPAWSGDVMVLDATDGSMQRYILRDGAIEYLIDEENPAWYSFVVEIDGVRSLGELLAFVAVPYREVAEPLWEAIDAGLVAVVARDERAGSVALLDAGTGSTRGEDG